MKDNRTELLMENRALVKTLNAQNAKLKLDRETLIDSLKSIIERADQRAGYTVSDAVVKMAREAIQKVGAEC